MYINKAALDGITNQEDPRGLLRYIFIEEEYSFSDIFEDFYFSEYLHFELFDFKWQDGDDGEEIELDDFDAHMEMEERMDEVEKEYNNFGWEVSRFEDGDNYHFISYPMKNKRMIDILVKLVNR